MKISEFIQEIILTFSNEKSLFSSKKIERFAVFSIMLLATIMYFSHHIFECTLAASDLVMIITVWLGYGGFNTIQTRKDKQNGINSEINAKSTENTDTRQA